MVEFIKPLGLITYILVWSTALAGLGLWKFHIRRIRPWMHFTLAGAALVSATTHLLLILSLD